MGVPTLELSKVLLFTVFAHLPRCVFLPSMLAKCRYSQWPSELTKCCYLQCLRLCLGGCSRLRRYQSVAVSRVRAPAQVSVPALECTKVSIFTVFAPLPRWVFALFLHWSRPSPQGYSHTQSCQVIRPTINYVWGRRQYNWHLLQKSRK